MLSLLCYIGFGIWGTLVNYPTTKIEEKQTLAIVGIVLSWLIPIAGIIIGYVNKPKNETII